MAEPTRILVVEDELSLRDDLEDYLTAKGYAVSVASCLAEARAILERQTLEAVILDIGLPDGDGLQLLPEIQQRLPSCGSVVLTAYGAPNSRINGLDSGADAYLVKRTSLREIEATLRSVLRRIPGTTPAESAGSDHWTLDKVTWLLGAPNGTPVRLTGTEMTFIEMLMESQGAVCQREQMIRSIGRQKNYDARSLDTVVRRLRSKVSRESGMEIPIKVVYGVGYRFTASLRPADTKRFP